MMDNRLLAPVAIVLALSASASAAESDGTTLSIEDGNGHVLATFSQSQLRSSFTQHELATATPWSPNGKVLRYRGAYLSDILRRYSLSTTDIEAAAADNYVTTLAAKDISTYSPLIAIDIACEAEDTGCVAGYRPLDIQHSGPFFIVWPLARFPQYYQETKNSIWVWFVTHLRPSNR